MKRFAFTVVLCASVCALPSAIVEATQDAKAPDLAPMTITSDGSVHTAAGVVDYQAVLGTFVVHPRGWGDAAARDDKDNPTAVATLSYVAYFKKGADAVKRPLTFLFNGGPGSSTIWLHMGAFGPRRVLTADHAHTPAASGGSPARTRPQKPRGRGQTPVVGLHTQKVESQGTGSDPGRRITHFWRRLAAISGRICAPCGKHDASRYAISGRPLTAPAVRRPSRNTEN